MSGHQRAYRGASDVWLTPLRWELWSEVSKVGPNKTLINRGHIVARGEAGSTLVGFGDMAQAMKHHTGRFKETRMFDSLGQQAVWDRPEER